MKIVQNSDNVLLKRKEIVAELDYEGGPTPSKNQLIDAIAAQLGVDKEKTEIVKISSAFGMSRGKALIFVWGEKPKPKVKKKESKEQGSKEQSEAGGKAEEKK